ncbi:MAG: TraB/GumN family protein [Sphingomonadaceae bacterium]|nr:TraB/GumN family protein [Sphingomonadaceae bacterium]
MTMLRTFLSTCFTALCCAALPTAALAQQTLPTPVENTRIPVEDVELDGIEPVGQATGPALWLVSDEDSRIYLFGTVHALPDGLGWYTETIRTALEGSDTLMTEIPMQPEDDAYLAQYALEAGTLPQGTTLRSLMNAEDLAAYETAMTGFGLPVETFDSQEPWMAALALSILPLMQEGYSADQGVEKKLIAMADDDTAFGALETIEYQIGLFDNMPVDDQVDFLLATAGQIDKTFPMMDAMLQEWLAGDPDGLAQIMNEGLTEDDELTEILLYNRNANWVDSIADMLAGSGNVFIAVGAGHLAGPKSVQELLGQRGIAVTRVQ